MADKKIRLTRTPSGYKFSGSTNYRIEKNKNGRRGYGDTWLISCQVTQQIKYRAIHDASFETLRNARAWIARKETETPDAPTITYNALVDILRINYMSEGVDPVYWAYPDDPAFPIARGYSGANINEIIDKMKSAGWIVTSGVSPKSTSCIRPLNRA